MFPSVCGIGTSDGRERFGAFGGEFTETVASAVGGLRDVGIVCAAVVSLGGGIFVSYCGRGRPLRRPQGCECGRRGDKLTWIGWKCRPIEGLNESG
ncbi:MAG: hypothetical protein ACTS4U_00635 [Candidatus Hodgkinia cicadicola]